MRTIEATETLRPIELTESAKTPEIAETIPAAVSTLTDQDAFAELLAEAPPGAGPLDELVCDRLSAAGRLAAVVAWERMVRHAHAGMVRALSALAHADTDAGTAASTNPIALVVDGMDLAEMEVCAALAWSPCRAQARLAEADVLTRLFPATLQHLSEGSIAMEQAHSLAELTGGLDDEAAKAVEAQVIARMPGQRLATTRQAIRRAIMRADPESAGKRHSYVRARRRVELIPEDDGMATLNFYLPADIAQMAMRTLTELAHSAKRKAKDSSDKRTLDQRRADLLPVLLHHAATGGTFSAAAKPTIPARVNVVVGIETLLGLSHEPGHLDGYGPIGPEQTRRIAHAHAARWNFLLTSTDGTLVEASTRSYRPPAAIKHLTQLRHPNCVFPNCGMPAERCDIDHNHPHHKGGATCIGNLAPLCRKHHNAKSFGHWELDRHDETICWISKFTGSAYTTGPSHYQPTPVQPNPGRPAPSQVVTLSASQKPDTQGTPSS
jgi:uncharacterized protein DUF222